MKTIVLVNESGTFNVKYKVTFGNNEETEFTVMNIEGRQESFDSTGLYVPFEKQVHNKADFVDFANEHALNMYVYDLDAATATWVNPPVISTLSPVDGAVDVVVSANLVATFDKDVTAVAGKFVTIFKTGDEAHEVIEADDAKITIVGGAVTINPGTNMDAATAHHVLIDKGAFVDDDGASFEGISSATTWNFTTA